jgi:hypothetical protein
MATSFPSEIGCTSKSCPNFDKEAPVFHHSLEFGKLVEAIVDAIARLIVPLAAALDPVLATILTVSVLILALKFVRLLIVSGEKMLFAMLRTVLSVLRIVNLKRLRRPRTNRRGLRVISKSPAKKGDKQDGEDLKKVA